jgi:NAD(P)-dependent dehydrogenase (short-subunit alcohol dehydrogenase family)
MAHKENDMSSAKRIALVTGANQGIGFETARQLAQEGVSVILSGRRLKEVAAAVDRLRSEGLSDVKALKLDINSAEDRLSVARYIADQFGRLDILVNNASLAAPEGTIMEPIISETSERELHAVFETNLFSVVLLTHTLLPLLKKSESGRIVNVSSQLGSLTLHAMRAERVARKKRFAYNASKAALNMFTILLAQELQDTNIKVNSVHPGWARTRLGGDAAPLGPAEGAKTSVEAALLGAQGPSGSFFEQDKPMPW